jgi:hypothetical protein
MKSIIPVLCIALLPFSIVLVAEEPATEERVIPTEISEPPYEVGDLPSEQGYYIQREGRTSINFRIVHNKMRVYWIDDDGLIAEPEASAGNARFPLINKTRNYYGLSPLPGDVGIGSEGIVRLPHIFNVILYLKNENGEGGESYPFRYLNSMDSPLDNKELDGSSAD